MSDQKHRIAWLIMVTEENNNKFYSMTDNGNGTFTAKWGRIEGNEIPANAQKKDYSIHEWDKTFNSKVKKGYVDRTSHRAETKLVETKNSKGQSIMSNDKHVADLFNLLQQYAKQQTAAVYTVEAKSVTQAMINDAQKCIDELTGLVKTFNTPKWSINLFNKELLNLFSIIPRKMGRVQDHLMTDTVKLETLTNLIGQEQSNIDSMASQVTADKADDAADDSQETTTQLTQLEAMGLSASLVTDKTTLDFVIKKADEHGKRVLRVFEVINKATQAEFDKQLASAADKKTDMMWHGSRKPNWFFIVQQGLRIRPSGAVYSGSMFSDGIYFACQADKSMGYTDNGRWVNGKGGDRVYMALYEVHLGKQMIIHKHDSSCYELNKTCPKQGFDSVWAKKGQSLYRDEFIVYKTNQATIKYLIEFSA